MKPIYEKLKFIKIQEVKVDSAFLMSLKVLSLNNFKIWWSFQSP